MIEIMTLPPQEAPKQLTARKVCESLGEHYTAFLAANNITGWVIDDHVLDDSHIADILFNISATTGLYIGRLATEGGKLNRLAKASGIMHGLHFWLNCVARALGYPHYTLAHSCRRENGFVENLWPKGAILDVTEFEDELPVKLMKNRIVQEMHVNYRANKLRDRQYNTLKDALKEAGKTNFTAHQRYKQLKKAKRAEKNKQNLMPIYYRIS